MYAVRRFGERGRVGKVKRVGGRDLEGRRRGVGGKGEWSVGMKRVGGEGECRG